MLKIYKSYKICPRSTIKNVYLRTSDFAAISMVQTFFSFFVLPCASSCKLVYFSSMSRRSCFNEKHTRKVHYLFVEITRNNINECNLLKTVLLKPLSHYKSFFTLAITDPLCCRKRTLLGTFDNLLAYLC